MLNRNNISKILQDEVKEFIEADYKEHLMGLFFEDDNSLTYDELEQLAAAEFDKDEAYCFYYDNVDTKEILSSIKPELLTEEIQNYLKSRKYI